MNLASLDNPAGEVIDFESGVLGSSDIFSIVGPTGSGKSTILDAICLPLYNRTPRYTRIRNERINDFQVFGNLGDDETVVQNRISRFDGRNILSRGKREGWSKLTFAANNGVVYRAEWRVTFKRRNYDKTVTSLYMIEPDGKETPCDWNGLTDIIGLDFHQFLRTVLIAQGSFAEFLNSDEKERMILLERLIGTQDMFTRLAEGIAEGRKKAQEELNKVEGRLAAYTAYDMTPEQLAELDTLITRLGEEKKLIEEEKKKIEEGIGWYSEAEKVAERISTAREQRRNAEMSLKEKDEESRRLRLYDLTAEGRKLYMGLVNLRKECEDLARERDKLKASVAEDRKKMDECAERVGTLREKLTESRKVLEEATPRIRRAAGIKVELKSLASHRDEAEETFRVAAVALEKSRIALEENNKQIVFLTEECGKEEKAIEDMRTEDELKEKELIKEADTIRTRLSGLDDAIRDVDIDTLRKKKESFTSERTHLEEAIRITGEIGKVDKKLVSRGRERDELIAANKETDERLEQLHLADMEREVRILSDSYTLLTSEQWNRHRSLLREGEPCPLCGATSHPYADGEDVDKVSDEMGKLLNDKREMLEKTRQMERKWRDEKSLNDGRLTSIGMEMKNEAATLAEYKELLSGLLSTYPEWPEDNDLMLAHLDTLKAEEKILVGKIEEYDKIRDAMEVERKNMEKISACMELFRKERDNSLAEKTNSLTDLRLRMAEKKTLVETLSADLKEKNRKASLDEKNLERIKAVIKEKEDLIRLEIGERDPDAYEQELSAGVSKSLAAVDNASVELSAMGEELGKKQGNLESVSSLEAEKKIGVGELSARLDEFVAGVNNDRSEEELIDREIVGMLAESDDDWEKLRMELSGLRDKFTATSATLDSETRASLRHEEKRPESSKEQLEARLLEIGSIDFKQLEEARVRRRSYEDARRLMGEDAAKKEKALIELSDWRELQEAIGTDGMRVRMIAQCYTLGFLISHANAEIRRFNSRYELVQVKNSLDIRVIDHDRANDIRDTTSLSGGESFIVSLGLALGLSALSSRNVSFDNLFIDEGFGSLDGETLATVIESLSMLQSSRGKKVGVISHTDLMSERIPTQIQVIRQGSTGSSRLRITTR